MGRRQPVKVNGKTYRSINDACKDLGVNRGTVGKHRAGMTLEAALAVPPRSSYQVVPPGWLVVPPELPEVDPHKDHGVYYLGKLDPYETYKDLVNLAARGS